MAKKIKIGRNDPCPCGSGKKFKRCHGLDLGGKNVFSKSERERIDFELKKHEALDKQRKQQQGLGKPIISIYQNGIRFVAVGDNLYHSEKWKTFEYFLFDYLKIALLAVLGKDWGNNDIQKPFQDQNPIMQWYHLICEHQKKYIKNRGTPTSMPLTGANAAYLNLSYNLYLIAHNGNLHVHQILIQRLANLDSFRGVFYETFVAAVFIRAGFDLEFEDETDSQDTHCEFSAISRKTGNKYSVEAKSRSPNKENANIRNQIYKALQKNAKFRRIVFVDINLPDSIDEPESFEFLEKAIARLRAGEDKIKIKGVAAPPAYVVTTNHPYLYNLDSDRARVSGICDGFKIDYFKIGSEFLSLRDARLARDNHADMYQLMKSMRDHYSIPTTFDGEIAELKTDQTTPRLIIGNRYTIPDENGNDTVGILTDAIVLESEGTVHATYKLTNGNHVIAQCPLTEKELIAYKKHPDTFFGIDKPTTKRLTDPLEIYDWLFKCYNKSSRDNLLELLKGASDFDDLQTLSQEELAIEYGERITYSTMQTTKT